MAREIAQTRQFEYQSHSHGLPKEKVVMRCDDSAVYEFEKAQGSPRWRLVARFHPDGTRSASSGALPASVKEQAEQQFGEKDKDWVKA